MLARAVVLSLALHLLCIARLQRGTGDIDSVIDELLISRLGQDTQ